MNYSVVSQMEDGSYQCEMQADDLSHAMRAIRQRTRESKRSHYLVDRKGRVIESVHPDR